MPMDPHPPHRPQTPASVTLEGGLATVLLLVLFILAIEHALAVVLALVLAFGLCRLNRSYRSAP